MLVPPGLARSRPRAASWRAPSRGHHPPRRRPNTTLQCSAKAPGPMAPGRLRREAHGATPRRQMVMGASRRTPGERNPQYMVDPWRTERHHHRLGAKPPGTHENLATNPDHPHGEYLAEETLI
ncbi:hypothetical protein Tco_1304548 [Tanacetum coccineum]